MFVASLSLAANRSTAISGHADVLRRVYTEVSEKLEAQSVARNMFQSNAITLKELQSIQSKRSQPIKAAEQLINIVMNQSGNVFSCFLDALKKAGHHHVYKVIVSGSYKGTKDDTRPGSVHSDFGALQIIDVLTYLQHRRICQICSCFLLMFQPR